MQGRVRSAAGEDRDSILISDGIGGFDARQAPLFHGVAQYNAGLGAVLSHRHHVRVIRRDFLDDTGKTAAAAALDVPDQEFHSFLDSRIARRVPPGIRGFLSGMKTGHGRESDGAP